LQWVGRREEKRRGEEVREEKGRGQNRKGKEKSGVITQLCMWVEGTLPRASERLIPSLSNESEIGLGLLAYFTSKEKKGERKGNNKHSNEEV
jgi:hypothetical protein